MFSLISNLDVKMQVALIGVGSALLTIIVKDVGLHFWKEARADKKTAFEVYRNYSDPLLSASVSLFWRLRETLIESGRGDYLRESGGKDDFDRYKFESTLFRLAVLIGWIRAYRRELAFFSLSRTRKLKPLEDALSHLESALADGTHVEIQRVKSVSELWGIPLPSDDKELSRISVCVEIVIRSLSQSRDEERRLPITLDEATKASLCRSVATCLCSEEKVDMISPEILAETQAKAARSLSIREAWLYRDYQSGIGDLMTREAVGASRRFGVLGFKEFEALLHSEDPETKRWISRLKMVFDSLDISGADRFDARVQMLERTFLATIDLIIALTEIDKGRTQFAEKTLSEAKKLKSETNWRKGGR